MYVTTETTTKVANRVQMSVIQYGSRSSPDDVVDGLLPKGSCR